MSTSLVSRSVGDQELVNSISSVLDRSSVSPTGRRDDAELVGRSLIRELSANSCRSLEGGSRGSSSVVAEGESGGDRIAVEEKKRRRRSRQTRAGGIELERRGEISPVHLLIVLETEKRRRHLSARVEWLLARGNETYTMSKEVSFDAPATVRRRAS